MIFRCWISDNTITDASKIDACDARTAAEDFTESEFNDGDPFEALDVQVSAMESDVVETFHVTVDMSPTFIARSA